MKCTNCPALVTEGYEYPETYCCIYPEEDIIEFANGDCGCKHPLNAIKSRVAKYETELSKQYESVGEWYEEQVSLEIATVDALISSLKRHECCIAHFRPNEELSQVDVFNGEDESRLADSLTSSISFWMLAALEDSGWSICKKKE